MSIKEENQMAQFSMKNWAIFPDVDDVEIIKKQRTLFGHSFLVSYVIVWYTEDQLWRQ